MQALPTNRRTYFRKEVIVKKPKNPGTTRKPRQVTSSVKAAPVCDQCGQPATQQVNIDIDAHWGPIEEGEFHGAEDGECLDNTEIKTFRLCDDCNWHWDIPRGLLRKVADCISLYDRTGAGSQQR